MSDIDDMFKDLDSIMAEMGDIKGTSTVASRGGSRPRSLVDTLDSIMAAAEKAGQERRQKELDEQARREREENARLQRAQEIQRRLEEEVEAKRAALHKKIEAAKGKIDEATAGVASAVAELIGALRGPVIFDDEDERPDFIGLARDTVAQASPIVSVATDMIEDMKRAQLEEAFRAGAAAPSGAPEADPLETGTRRMSIPVSQRKRSSLQEDIFYPAVATDPHLPMQLSVDLVLERLRTLVAVAKEVTASDVAATRQRAAAAAYQLLVAVKDVRDHVSAAVEADMRKNARI